MQTVETGVVIVGAGASGLAAASLLAAHGMPTHVVEARDRVGGRVASVARAYQEHAVELGAEFVHGRPPSLLALIDEGRMSFRKPGRTVSYRWTRGKPAQAEPELDGFFDLLERLDPAAPDCDAASFLTQASLPAHAATAATRFIEGFNAADARRISVQALAYQQRAEDSIAGERQGRLLGPYSRIPELLLERARAGACQLHLQHRVTGIRWQRGSVALDLETGNGSTQFMARRVILSAPLNLLGEPEGIVIDPLPAALATLKRAVAMGHAARVTFLFREPFWLDVMPRLSFLFADREEFAVWWATGPELPLLTAWVGGPAAQRFTGASQEEIAQRALHSLAQILTRPLPYLAHQCRQVFTNNWTADPFSLGAYSYVVAGGLPAAREADRPIEETLFLAGEACATDGHWGTVHGAIDSGYRAARRLLDTW